MSINGDAMLFSAPMVRALWDGRKTQTRRPLYMLRKGDEMAQRRAVHLANYPAPTLSTADAMDRYYDLRHILTEGDRIWVRENWRVSKNHDDKKPSELPVRKCTVMFEAGGCMGNSEGGWRPDGTWPVAGALPNWAGKLRPSIFLPRWASRMTLPVLEVRIQRLQDISEEDAIAEGIERLKSGRGYYDPRGNHGEVRLGHWFRTAREAYHALWEHINGGESWDANPWVVAYTITVIKANIDTLPKAA